MLVFSLRFTNYKRSRRSSFSIIN